jgi:hypothetical protein
MYNTDFFSYPSISYVQHKCSLLLWLRQYTTSQKVAGSRPDVVNIFFNLPNHFGSIRLWGLLSL